MYLFGLIKAIFMCLKSVRTDRIMNHSDIGTKKIIPKWATKLLVSVLHENYRETFIIFMQNNNSTVRTATFNSIEI